MSLESEVIANNSEPFELVCHADANPKPKIVWLDDRLGTCDHRLVLEPRPCNIDLPRPSERSVRISELQAKISKDKANLHGLGEDVPNEHRHLV